MLMTQKTKSTKTGAKEDVAMKIIQKASDALADAQNANSKSEKNAKIAEARKLEAEAEEIINSED